jgi:hypothetical protein
MKKEYILRIYLVCCVIGLILACAGTEERWVPPAVHPDEEGENLKYCTDCHDEADEYIPYRRYVHTPLFMENHRPVVTQNVEVCYTCHSSRFCNDCHEIETHVLGQAWLDSTLPGYHGNQPQQDCDNCHNLSTDCYQCHFGPTGRKSPPGSNWPHGREDNHNDQKSYSAICNQCHSLTQEYRDEPDDPECHVCHNE